jgi:hypothetical protein
MHHSTASFNQLMGTMGLHYIKGQVVNVGGEEGATTKAPKNPRKPRAKKRKSDAVEDQEAKADAKKAAKEADKDEVTKDTVVEDQEAKKEADNQSNE